MEHFVCVRGIVWLPMTRLNPSTLIFYPRPNDPMWRCAYASHMNRRKSKENCYKPPLACVSCFWSLITLLFLSSVPAYPGWAPVEKGYLLPGLQTVYVDPESIRREGNLMTMWQLIDFKSMQGSARGPCQFLSTRTHKQFDCAEKRLRFLAFMEFSRGMGSGTPADGYVGKGNWLSVEPDSINQALWEVAWGKE